jgi:hypothetical protein
MKKLLEQEFIMDWWLTKYHGITIDWLRENEPNLIKTSARYIKYAVTQEQHDEWYNWAIDYMAKYYHMSKKYTKRNFCFDYLNCSPSVIKDGKI